MTLRPTRQWQDPSCRRQPVLLQGPAPRRMDPMLTLWLLGPLAYVHGYENSCDFGALQLRAGMVQTASPAVMCPLVHMTACHEAFLLPFHRRGDGLRKTPSFCRVT